MGWVERRPERLPRACWRSEGRVVRRTCATVDEAEEVLRAEEGCDYRPAGERRAGRPAGGVRGHLPNITHYSRHKCRGAGCVAAWSEYQKKRRASKPGLEDAKHGMIDTYNRGCHCLECDAVGAAYRLNNEKRRKAQYTARADDLNARRRASRAAARINRSSKGPA